MHRVSLQPCISLLIIALALPLLSSCASPGGVMWDGDQHAREGRYTEALREYQVARRMKPELLEIDRKIRGVQIALLLDLGDRAIEEFRWQTAAGAFQEVRRLDPTHPDLDRREQRLLSARAQWHYDRSERALAFEDLALVLVELEQCLLLDPNHLLAKKLMRDTKSEVENRRARAETIFRVGIEEKSTGQLLNSIRIFEEVLTLNPDHVEAKEELESIGGSLDQWWIELGDRQSATGDWESAANSYEQATRREGSSVALFQKLRRARRESEALEASSTAEVALQKHDYEGAFRSLELAIHLTAEPEQIRTQFLRVQSTLAERLLETARDAIKEGRFNAAVCAFRRVTDVYPNHPRGRESYGHFLQRLEDAEIAFQSGYISFEQRDLSQAIENLTSCLELLPQFPHASDLLSLAERQLQLAESLYQRGRIAHEDGQPRRARIFFEECASIAWPFRDLEERLELVRSADFVRSGFPAVYQEGCRAQCERDFVRAVSCFLKTIESRPDSEEIATRLADSRSAVSQAMEFYSRAREAEGRFDLVSARNLYSRCVRACAPYRDAEARLVVIRNALDLLRRARRHEGRRELVAALSAYKDLAERFVDHPAARQKIVELEERLSELKRDEGNLLKAEVGGEPRRALAIAVSIRERCRDFQEIDRTYSRLLNAADYLDGQFFESSGAFELARQSYLRILLRAVDYLDARLRVEQCRRKQEQIQKRLREN